VGGVEQYRKEASAIAIFGLAGALSAALRIELLLSVSEFKDAQTNHRIESSQIPLPPVSSKLSVTAESYLVSVDEVG
jgi:hypothetical protein